MIIHLVRHAEAIDRTVEVPEDHRFLTVRGRKRFRKVAESLVESGIKPDIILTSPLIRAVQTADILAEALHYREELQVTPLLSPGFGPESLEELLKILPQGAEIVLVGHEPDFGELAQALLSELEACSLQKGAVLSCRRTAGTESSTEFLQYVTGGGKIVTSRSKALERLQGKKGS